MDASLDFSQLMETLRGTAGPLSSQEALALALPDLLELSADEYTDGLELAISIGALSRLSPLDLQRLLQRADEIPVRSGEVVIEQGARGRECYLVKHGSARIQREGTAQEPAIKGPGELFGEEALITGDPREGSVIMCEDGVLLRLSAEDFNALILPCLQRSISRAEAEALVERGAWWLDVREHGAGLGLASQSVVLPWSSFREEYRRLDDRVAWVVCAERSVDAALAAFRLRLAGYESSYLDESLPGVEPQQATALQVESAPALVLAEDDPVRIGLEDVRAFERQRHQRHLRKTVERLQAEADARVAHAVETTERRLLAEVRKRQQQLLELRQENARLQSELARWRGLAALPGAGWSAPQSVDII